MNGLGITIKRTALKGANFRVISSEMALQYFGRLDVVNEVLTVASFTKRKKGFYNYRGAGQVSP